MGQALESPQLAKLRVEWPATAAELLCTYFAGVDAGRTQGDRHNDAGYALWGLARFELHATQVHAAHGYTHAEIDQAASAEVRYHWHRGTTFKRPVAALIKCWFNLVHERPERLVAARRAACGGHGGEERGSLSRSVASVTATVSRCALPACNKAASVSSPSGLLESMILSSGKGLETGTPLQRRRYTGLWPTSQ